VQSLCESQITTELSTSMPAFDRHAADQRRAVWPPEPGHFRLSLVRGGWRVPARLSVTVDGWQAEIDGIAYPPDPDPARATGVERVWTGGEIIDQSEHDWLVEMRTWARTHAPDHPAANPLQAINPSELRPLMPRGHTT
jgi:hypothetical protein